MQPAIKRIHFVGIGGIGMSGLAEIMMNQGFRVSGSDRQLSPVTDRLTALGATVFEGHRASQVNADLVVYTSAAPTDNPEIAEAVRRGIPCIKRSALLGEVLRERHGIAVSGTHGKTTTTAMIGLTLRHAGLDPSILVGGVMTELGTNAITGTGRHIVVEADEYDRSFLELRPRITVINNIESDHLDCYRDLDDIRFTFADFANQTSVFGCVVINSDDPVIAGIHDRIHRRMITVGLSDQADFSAANIHPGKSGMSFDVCVNGKSTRAIQLSVPGNHNVRNALACIAVANELSISIDVVAESLAGFRGTARRFEMLGVVNGVSIVDDYAHHPTEIRATLEGARKMKKNGRIVAVFQPHLFSRTRDYLEEFAQSFTNADVVVLTDVYAARELPIPGVDGQALSEATRRFHPDVRYVKNVQELPNVLKNLAESDDLIITMGAGDITTVGRQLIKQL